MKTHHVRLFGLLCLSASLLGCEEEAPIVDYAVVTGDDGALPALGSPFTTEETTSLREGFDWADTEALLESDTEGRPAYYYALVLVGGEEQRALLELARIYYDAMPLFPEEMAPWENAGPGTIDIVGDDHGAFVFSFLPGAVYNELRRMALEEGEPAFEAVLLRDVPDPTAIRPEGYLDLDVLVERGCTMGFTDEELASAEATADAGEGVGAASAPLFGRIARALARIGRGIANAFRRLVAVVRLKRDFSLRMRVVNSDEVFRGSDPTPPGGLVRDSSILRQGWGAERGRPLVPTGIRVAVRTNLGITFRDLSSTGEVAMRVPRDESFTVFLHLRNAAATLTVGTVFERRVLLGRGNFAESDRSRPVHVVRDILDRSVHEISLFTEARDFAVQQLGFRPARAVVVDVPNLSGASSTGCFSFFGFGTTAFGHGRGWSLAASFIRIIEDQDISIRGNDAAGRGVIAHEYGHFLMCNMFRNVSRRDFGRAYGQVIQQTVSGGFDGDIKPTDEARIVAEAWADFYAAQVVGGTNYFFSPGTRMNEARDMAFCDGDRFDASDPCTENNVALDDSTAWTKRLETLTTLMVDVFDGTTIDPAGINAGVRWRFTPTVGSAPTLGAGLPDERVSLRGRDLREIVESWSRHANYLRVGNFHGAMARVLLRSFDEDDVCQAFALHDPTGDCATLATLLSRSVAPFGLGAGARLNSTGTTPVVTARWDGLDPAATTAHVELRVDDAPVEDVDLPYARVGTWASTQPIAFDAPAIVRVSARGGGADESRVAQRFLRTPAEPVRSLTATASIYSVYLHFPETKATSYRVRVTDTVTGEVTWVDIAGSGELVNGLTAEVPYSFEVYSVNAVGEQCPRSSPTAVATPFGIGAG